MNKCLWTFSQRCQETYHRSLDLWKSIYSPQEELFVQQTSFVSFLVTRPVITQDTSRYKMRQMDIIFPRISFSVLWVKWLGYYSLSQSSIFSKSCNSWKLTNLAQQRNSSNQWLPILGSESEILTRNQSQINLKTPKFHKKKEFCW